MSPQLTEIDEAREIVLRHAKRLQSERVDLRDALGRVLASNVTSTQAVPSFDNSAMDGFALRHIDVRDAGPQTPVRLSVVDESRAGRPAERAVGVGEAIAISTGAAMPTGADAVVPIERTSPGEGGVGVLEPVPMGNDVRRAGEDLREGQEVLCAGALIGAAHLGVLASLGEADVPCVRRPRLALLLTGDELLEPGEDPRPGAIYDSNAFSIASLARRRGAVVGQPVTVRDDPLATREAIAPALRDSDVVVICGGISVGAHDHVRASLGALDVHEHFWGIALKPGKPTWFGTRGSTLVFGLPGNPVSAMVTFVLLVAPALRALQGDADVSRRSYATLTEAYRKRPDRAHAVRCRLTLSERGWLAQATGDQSSHILSSMVAADALALIPTATTSVGAGERVEILLLEGAPLG